MFESSRVAGQSQSQITPFSYTTTEKAAAVQTFSVTNDELDDHVGYVMGHLEIPKGAFKDTEPVYCATHTFTVISCQPGSVEVALQDPRELLEGEEWDEDTAQRFLLSSGDMFRIPPENSYRVLNHSKEMDALLSWTIIKAYRPKQPSS